MKVKSMGDLSAFPMPAHPTDVIDEIGCRTEDGMTYRQWLVAKIASGLAANPSVGTARIVEMAFQLTDEIIERLDQAEQAAAR
ncbi:MAG: hypothetical protein HRF43_19865 [Phycisphaerae bacterium]|jgi:hypothetical protein